MELKPLGDRVVVKAKDDQEARTASGLVIPIVKTVDNALPQEGDTVVYSKYGGTEIKFEGQEYLILSSRDLLAVVA